jgi:hypothetical protein
MFLFTKERDYHVNLLQLCIGCGTWLLPQNVCDGNVSHTIFEGDKCVTWLVGYAMVNGVR